MIIKKWKSLWNNKSLLGLWVALFAMTIFTMKMVCYFFVFNEKRTVGPQLNDFVLDMIPAADVSVPLFAITWLSIFFFLPISMITPKKSIIAFLSMIILAILRCLCLYFIPLIPPEGIIPLRDSILEGSFYSQTVMVRDLFFSGHTANLALLLFMVDGRKFKVILSVSTTVVGILLLIQHVHYTIDVVAAPFFAYASYSLGVYISERLYAFVEVKSLPTKLESKPTI